MQHGYELNEFNPEDPQLFSGVVDPKGVHDIRLDNDTVDSSGRAGLPKIRFPERVGGQGLDKVFSPSPGGIGSAEKRAYGGPGQDKIVLPAHSPDLSSSSASRR